MSAIHASFHPMSAYFQRIVRLNTRSQRLTLNSRTRRITRAISVLGDHVIRSSRTGFSRINVLNVGSHRIRRSHRISRLVSLFRTRFNVCAFFNVRLFIQMRTSATSILANVFLNREKVTMTLPRTNTSGTMINGLMIRSNTRSQFSQGLNSRRFNVHFPRMAIRPMMFNARTNQCTRTIRRALIMLSRRNNVITIIHPNNFQGTFRIFMNYPNNSLASTIPFLVRLMICVMNMIFIHPFKGVLLIIIRRPKSRITMVNYHNDQRCPIRSICNPIRSPIRITLRCQLSRQRRQTMISILSIISVNISYSYVTSRVTWSIIRQLVTKTSISSIISPMVRANLSLVQNVINQVNGVRRQISVRNIPLTARINSK